MINSMLFASAAIVIADVVLIVLCIRAERQCREIKRKLKDGNDGTDI